MPRNTHLTRAREALAPYLLKTPLVLSDALSEKTQGEVWVKLESLQRTGSFKVRGALWKILGLSPDQRKRGVITASAGNHGRGMVHACNLMEIPCQVFVPETLSPTDVKSLEVGMAIPRVIGRGYDESEQKAMELAQKEDLPFVSAFDDPKIIEGNGGTLGLEILEEISDPDILLAPVGGGGLIGGLGLAIEEFGSKTKLHGAQSEASCAMARSLERGEAILTLPPAETLATRLEGGVAERTFQLARRFVEKVSVVTEESLAHAVHYAAHEMRVVLEPSGAAGIAALLSERIPTRGKKIVVVASGGNIAANLLTRLLKVRYPVD